ncbi:hypothetical protein [uncultured Hymenobacter sp.]|uniref:hypothetical protein n=1 Tax=uncultured Hymenobacter sp. TaxID=170016 RepID=UPI0035CC55B8
MRNQNIEDVLKPLYQGLIPLFLLVNYAYYFSIYDLLDEPIGQANSSMSGRYVLLWNLIIITLCISGIMFSYERKRQIFTTIYATLLLIEFVILVFLSALSGVDLNIH